MCMAVAFAHGGAFLLTGYEDGTLALWDTASTNRPKATVKPHAEPVMALAVQDQSRALSR